MQKEEKRQKRVREKTEQVLSKTKEDKVAKEKADKEAARQEDGNESLPESDGEEFHEFVKEQYVAFQQKVNKEDNRVPYTLEVKPKHQPILTLQQVKENNGISQADKHTLHGISWDHENLIAQVRAHLAKYTKANMGAIDMSITQDVRKRDTTQINMLACVPKNMIEQIEIPIQEFNNPDSMSDTFRLEYMSVYMGTHNVMGEK
jgi:hypothetical protein